MWWGPRLRSRVEFTMLLSLQPENSVDLVSRELYAHSIRKLQAHVLFIK